MLQHLFSLTPPSDESDEPAPSDGWRLAVAAGGQRVALAAGDLLEVFDCTRPSVWPVCRFRLPLAPDEGQVAVHPDGHAIVIAERGNLQALSSQVGDPSFPAAVDPAWGEPGAVTFDAAGEVVWATFAEGDKVHVCAVDWATGTFGMYGALELPGIEEASHRLLFVPTRPGVVAVALHHPERGAQLHFVANQRTELVALGEGVVLNGQLKRESAYVAGFSEDGGQLTIVCPDRLERWRISSPEPARARALDKGMTFVATGCLMDGALLTLLRAQQDDSLRVAAFDDELALQSSFTHQGPAEGEAPQACLGVVGLANKRVLLVGDRRAGVFELAGG